MKKGLCLIMTAILAAICLSSCSTKNNNDGSLDIITTIFPEFDWTKQILGDNPSNINLTLLTDNGIDIHSYQPSAEDIVNISNCDVFIYVGGESDKWIDDVLSDAQNKDMVVVNLMEILGDSAKEEEIVEGMEIKEEIDDSALDEHVWLSLKNASVFCDAITKAIISIDDANAELYKSNNSEYKSKLNELDKRYETELAECDKDTVVFCDRFPCRYMFDDYNLNYYAPFLGCSTETQANFDTIIFLANKLDALELGAVMQIETSDSSVADTIIQNSSDTSRMILPLNSLQSTTSADISDGLSYLLAMETNLESLKMALN